MLCFVFAALIVVLDQFFKRWIVLTLEIRELGPDIIPGVIGLTRWENDGAMLNILAGQKWLLAGVAFVAAIVFIAILLRYNEGFWGTLGLASVLGGTVGNLADRVFNDGAVIDMFKTQFINFPIFNIADIFITLGFATFCIHFIAVSLKAEKSEAESSEEAAQQLSVPHDEAYDLPNMQDAPDFDSFSDTTVVSAQPQPYPVSPVTPVSPEPIPAAQPEQIAYEPDPPVVSSPVPEPPADALPALEALETLEALESELGQFEDYNVDDLLREYGFEEDND